MKNYEKVYLYRHIVQAKLFIDKHFAENLRLEEIADHAYFSKFHFIRLFKSIYGKSPHNYLVKVRIDQAKLLLEQGLPVIEVCTSIGFDSPTSFSAAFKREVGKTPSEFQKAHRIRKQQIRLNPLSVIPNCFAENHGWVK